jgi:hypothetical protein
MIARLISIRNILIELGMNIIFEVLIFLKEGTCFPS